MGRAISVMQCSPSSVRHQALLCSPSYPGPFISVESALHGMYQEPSLGLSVVGSYIENRFLTMNMSSKRKSKGAYMVSAVAEMYEIHPQTLWLYEREGRRNWQR